jgi:hypothetical protein
MIMSVGSVTLNSLDDREMAVVFEFKARHEGIFGFDPKQMNTVNIGGNPPKIAYNNVILSWNKLEGLKLLVELIEKLQRPVVERRA